MLHPSAATEAKTRLCYIPCTAAFDSTPWQADTALGHTEICIAARPSSLKTRTEAQRLAAPGPLDRARQRDALCFQLLFSLFSGPGDDAGVRLGVQAKEYHCRGYHHRGIPAMAQHRQLSAAVFALLLSLLCSGACISGGIQVTSACAQLVTGEQTARARFGTHAMLDSQAHFATLAASQTPTKTPLTALCPICGCWTSALIARAPPQGRVLATHQGASQLSQWRFCPGGSGVSPNR